MKRFLIETSKNQTVEIEAKDEAEAKKGVQALIDDENAKPTGKILGIKEVLQPAPDNSHVEENGGYNFTGWGIHVVAKTLTDAKKLVKDIYGVDVDKDNAPHPEQVAAGQA